MKIVKGLEGKPYEEWLSSRGLVSPEKKRPHCSYNLLVSGRGGTGTDLFSVVTSDRTRGNGLKLFQGRFRLDIILHPEGGWVLEQAPQGSSHSTKPDRVQ
ncbi:hypothetical protein BTVI_98017 [Pitangus sulphuratus]|nr:hypothetical protein BTVI_98017 [Pitangus sulphuratus]